MSLESIRDNPNGEGIVIDMTGSSLRRRQKEAREVNQRLYTQHENALLPNVSIRMLFGDAFKSALWILDVFSRARYRSFTTDISSTPDLLRGLGVIFLLIGLSGIFIFEAF